MHNLMQKTARLALLLLPLTFAAPSYAQTNT